MTPLKKITLEKAHTIFLNLCSSNRFVASLEGYPHVWPQGSAKTSLESLC